MNADIRRIFLAQTLRAFAYGFGSVMLGVTLDQQGWSTTEVGLLLTSVVAGTALMSVLVGTFAERIGRRRLYVGLFAGLALIGAVFALTAQFWILLPVALTGVLSTDVVESGPFTSLEQAMLPMTVPPPERTRVFAWYNAIAALSGSLGALSAGGPALLRDNIGGLPGDQRFFLAFLPVALAGAAIASTLSSRVEADSPNRTWRPPLDKSRDNVLRLSGLFAVDAFAGGFVIQTFIAYWFKQKFGLSVETLGIIFFAIGMLQTASFFAASRLAGRFGLLNTMVFTHIPSNILLAGIAFAPTLGIALVLLFGRFALSQMDVPTRQAYIAGLVAPEERTAAAAYTNTARYVVRPLGPVLAGAGQQLMLGFPFLVAGSVKIAYDVALYLWFRNVQLPDDEEETP